MSSMQSVMCWLAMGLAAAIAAWILPFRRGVVGIAVNAVVALFGAVAFPMLGLAIGITKSTRDPNGFALAALGSIGLLVLLHVLWERSTQDARGANPR